MRVVLDGKVHDPDIEVALARRTMLALGYRRDQTDSVLWNDVLVEEVVAEELMERAEDQARTAAWFAKAAQDSEVIRVQPVKESMLDG